MTIQADQDLARTARIFHALSDETRLRVLELLRRGERCVCELTEALDLGQSRLSFHLKCLKDAGLLRDRRDGRWIHYSLDPDGIGEVEELIAEMAKSAAAAPRSKACCD
jgi:ArsR family transcriptional regulator